jgi:hypothetical protein
VEGGRETALSHSNGPPQNHEKSLKNHEKSYYRRPREIRGERAGRDRIRYLFYSRGKEERESFSFVKPCGFFFLSLSHTHTLSLSLPPTLSLSLSLFLSLSLPLSPSIFLPLSLCCSDCLYFLGERGQTSQVFRRNGGEQKELGEGENTASSKRGRGRDGPVHHFNKVLWCAV